MQTFFHFKKTEQASEMPNQNTTVERKELCLFYQPKSWFKKKKSLGVEQIKENEIQYLG